MAAARDRLGVGLELTPRSGFIIQHQKRFVEVKSGMKMKSVYIAGLFVFFILASCSGGVSDDKQIIATINEFELTKGEFLRLLAADMETDENFKLTESAKKKYLNEIVQKEILIQEAKRLKLDRKPKFIRTIERYWESTLIRDLMAAKGEEIAKEVVVSQEEIEKRYAQLKKGNKEYPALDQIESDIEAALKEEKKTRMFKAWVEKMRQSADVRIDWEKLANL